MNLIICRYKILPYLCVVNQAKQIELYHENHRNKYHVCNCI